MKALLIFIGALLLCPTARAEYELNYFGIYAGGPLSSPTSKGTVSTSTLDYDEYSPQYLFNQVRYDYYLSEDVIVGAVLNFQLTPSDHQTFMFLDSGLRIGHNRIFQIGNLKLLGDFRVMAPLKPSYRALDEKLDLQSLQVLVYDVPKTKLTIGILGFHYFQVYGSGAPIGDSHDPQAPRDLNLYFAPNLNYQFTQSFAGTLHYEIYPYHTAGASWDTFGTDPSDFAVGVNWNITPDISINPQIVLYPSRLNFDTMSSRVQLSAKIL